MVNGKLLKLTLSIATEIYHYYTQMILILTTLRLIVNNYQIIVIGKSKAVEILFKSKLKKISKRQSKFFAPVFPDSESLTNFFQKFQNLLFPFEIITETIRFSEDFWKRNRINLIEATFSLKNLNRLKPGKLNYCTYYYYSVTEIVSLV